jgi:lipoprotein-anchoring transpeptidase ErfK/SrfK
MFTRLIHAHCKYCAGVSTAVRTSSRLGATNREVQGATSRTLSAPKIAVCLIQIFRECGVKLFTRLRDWMDVVSAVECIMSQSRFGRVRGVFLLAGLVTTPIAPACAQALSYGPADTVVPGYQIPGADEASTPALRRQVVDYPSNEPAGTIVIDPVHTFLYLTLGGGKAMRYGIGVGREGFAWSGVETIKRKSEWPDWIPPAAMIARQPYLPRWIGGGPGNPLGARALYLGNTDYRIHGTNAPDSIGKHMSSGCIRMLNADVIDLYNRVSIGAKVIVLPDARARQISDAASGTVTPAASFGRAAARKSGAPSSGI